ALQRVLPPRPGGPLALIDAAGDADVVFVAHVGFEGLASLTAVLSGALVGQTIHLKFWRVPRAEIPTHRDERVDWLWRQWEALDRWVSSHATRPGERSA
ncbi:MAG TPA: 1-acyl-sn-glycerol-3-phosphate acyltransferase, partial [Myxococcota bacterium]|nr:1-acyl-sn-glycerol-3-phosphate acyltransferase [Myxococcota bacterium]